MSNLARVFFDHVDGCWTVEYVGHLSNARLAPSGAEALMVQWDFMTSGEAEAYAAEINGAREALKGGE